MIIENGLNPNCSEAVFRYGGYVGEIDTGGDLAQFTRRVRKEVQDFKKDGLTYGDAEQEYLIAYDNLGGGANFESLAAICHAVVREVYKGEKKLTKKALWDLNSETAPKVPIDYR